MLTTSDDSHPLIRVTWGLSPLLCHTLGACYRLLPLPIFGEVPEGVHMPLVMSTNTEAHGPIGGPWLNRFRCTQHTSHGLRSLCGVGDRIRRLLAE